MEARLAVYVLDDDPAFGAFLKALLGGVNLPVELFARPADLLASLDPSSRGLVLLDLRLPEMSGIEVLRELRTRGISLPVLAMSAFAGPALAVQAIKEGAVDFLEKPLLGDATQAIVDAVQGLLRLHAPALDGAGAALDARYRLLSSREREVAALVRAGRSSKQIARELGLSTRTVEGHRARILTKLGAKNAADLVRILNGVATTQGS